MSIKHESGGVLSSNHDWFHYNKHERVWRRVLIRSGKTQGFLQQVSIQLTPSKGWNDQESVEAIKDCIIQVHEPAPSIHDKYTHLLPVHVYNKITKTYGSLLRNVLLDKDLLRYIDFKKLVNFTSSKEIVPLAKCQVLEPNKKGLIERLSTRPELYDMPYALTKHINTKVKPSKRIR